MGPIRDPLSTVIPMTVVYVLILLTGVVGNVCTCVVIANNKYMHTATNYYLFSLAVSDLLLLLLGLPQELYQLWQKYPYVFGESVCILRGLTSEMSTNASILTITAFTVERYVAICHPLKAHTMSQLPRAIKTILIIWALGAICAVPVAWQFGILYLLTSTGMQIYESAQCTVKRVIFEYGFETTTLVFFIIPITLISVLYVLIGVHLHRSSRQVRSGSLKELSTSETNSSHNHSVDYQRHNSTSSAQNKQNASRRSVIKMLVAVVISFFFCYSPFHAQRVLAVNIVRNNVRTPVIISVYTILTHISGVTYYLSSTINPILYQLMSRKYRIAFRDTFGKCIPCLKRSQIPELTYSAVLTGNANSFVLYRSGSAYSSNGSARRGSASIHSSGSLRRSQNLDRDGPKPKYSTSCTNLLELPNNSCRSPINNNSNNSGNFLTVPVSHV
ncbi:pyrokinin-1 receptor-like [Oppia nitens]|uniref:pyrokinin-1 receptor-like n=1 Tax=Oppia nitens TaxID=1686743 RepID=UPI0023DCD63B|nr:pyrokinin-1 receptor-like [Oppia nitens]